MSHPPYRLLTDRYRLLSVIGEGGMGTVWRAEDERLRREVAVKEMHVPKGPGATALCERMEREALAMARVRHRGIVTIYDVVFEDDKPWIIMELLDAVGLDRLVRTQGPLRPARAARIGAEVLDALRAVHRAGILHRDVKPSNVLLSGDGHAVLTDFGVATFDGATTLTESGQVIGSPAYMAPEVAKGERATTASDMWSLGATLYFAVEGSAPYRRDSAVATIAALITQDPPAPVNAERLGAAILGALCRDVSNRATADELARLLGSAFDTADVTDETKLAEKVDRRDGGDTRGDARGDRAESGGVPSDWEDWEDWHAAYEDEPGYGWWSGRRKVAVVAALCAVALVVGIGLAWLSETYGQAAGAGPSPDRPGSGAPPSRPVATA